MVLEFLTKLIEAYPWILGIFVGGITVALFVSITGFFLFKTIKGSKMFMPSVDLDDMAAQVEERVIDRLEAVLAQRNAADERTSKIIDDLLRLAGELKAKTDNFATEIIRMRDHFHHDLAPKIQQVMGMAENNSYRLDQIEPKVHELTKSTLSHENRLITLERRMP